MLEILVMLDIILPLMQLDFIAEISCFYLRFWSRYYFRLCWGLILGEESQLSEH